MKKLYGCLFLLCCIFLFSACENFMLGNQLRTELKKQIEIANSKELNVEINLRSSHSGTISPAGISKIKKNVPFEIELTVKSGYEFNGEFNVFEKSGGKTTKIKTPETVIRFEEKSKYNAGVGNTNYIFEAVLLSDDYSALLINPDILNPSSIEPPKILDAKINYRYGDEKNIRDYFDVELFVECDSEPNNLVYVSFIDSWGDSVDAELIGTVYDADIEDVGNGKYHMSASVDLRETWLMHEEEYRPVLMVENDGNVQGSFEFSKPFVFQPYSKTKIQVYNDEETSFDEHGENWYNPIIYDDCAKTEESLAAFTNNLRLIVFDIDENGLGLDKDGKPVELKYGFCQDLDEIENLELNNTISEYSVYDFETEFEELLPKIKNAIYEKNEWGFLNYYLESHPDLEYTSALDLLNHYNNEEEIDYEPSCDLTTFDFDLRAEHDQAFFNERQNIYEVLEKYRNQAFQNKSIVQLNLPENLDKTKNVYVKVSSENGVDNQKYVIFTIPAPTIVLGTEPAGENLKIKLHEVYNSGYNYVYFYNSNLRKWVGTRNSFFNNKYADSGFYVSFVNRYEHQLENYNHLSRNFNLHTLGIRKYNIGEVDTGIKKFPTDAEIEILSKGLDSKKHEISITLDREIYNQFDSVFIRYGQNLYDMDNIELQDDNIYSFDVATEEFYSSSEKKRANYSFSVLGVKNGVSYETIYTIDASDDRVEDNIPPSVTIEAIFDFDAGDLILTTVAVDATGNFLTIMGTPTDIGDNLADMVPVDISIIKDDWSFIERISAEGDVTKYLNIPVNHLENGKYILELSLEDTIGNKGSVPAIFFEVNRESVSDKIHIIETDGNKWTINAAETDAQKYALSYFDESEKLWKALETSGDVKAPAEYEKTGFFQLHLNNPNDYYKYHNEFKYPYLFYFPEEKVVERDFQVWRNSIRISTDKPFFIHFLKSDIDWGKDVEAWEGHQSYSYSIGNNEIYEPFYTEMYGSCFKRTFAEIKKNVSPFTGSEVNPCVVDGDWTATPYVCQIPWEKLDKEYAAAVIIWADNKKDLILLNNSLR